MLGGTKMRYAAWLGLIGALWACDDGGFTPLPGQDMRPVDQFVRPDAEIRDMSRAPRDDFGDPCAENAECASNFCIAVADGRACSRRCGSEEDCPDGWFCAQVTNPGADVTFICVPEDAPCAGADLMTDPEHCGFCDNACTYPSAEALCVEGDCRIGDCTPGAVDLDGDPQTGCEYACTPTLDGMEACDAIDNDCDGAVDEGIDTQSDLAHCGGCGQRCAPPNARASCVDGACLIEGCLDGFIDVDGDPANGCEVGCAPSNDGVEACDTIDNDCDGQADEGFDLQTDGQHCGACNQPCTRPNAVAECQMAQCVFVECAPDFYDRNGDPADGCEVGCQRSNAGVERCDGIDNDCDGPIDEGFDVQTDVLHCGACDRPCARPNAMRACLDGQCRDLACVDGFFDLDGVVDNGCEYACEIAGEEQCNGADDDCNGRADEGFDLMADVAHCGGCGQICAPAAAEPACIMGDCRIAACDAGFVDLDGAVANGCEYACARDGAELCDQRDNDCDGQTDEGFDTQTDVAHCGGCGMRCAPENAAPLCVGGQCRIDACQDGFADADGEVGNGCECTIRPEVCDRQDNDCDGRVDEAFDTQTDVAHCGGCNQACAPANAGGLCVNGGCRIDACADGFADADGDASNGCECVIAAEACDGADNDCDGRIDETFDFDSDLAHCGGCDQPCAPENAAGLCAGGACRVDLCDGGWRDRDRDPSNGCECRVQFESCNAMDDDCDGAIDEDFDFDFDVNHCGGCGQRCDPPNAIGLCAARQCRIDDCLPGYVDGDGEAANGCELHCDGADADHPACGGGGPDIEYPGMYDFAPPFRYSCSSLFGDVVVLVNSSQLTFSLQGDALLIDGLNVQMRMSPAPDGADFSASGVIAGDCQETFLLDASYIDADTWRGTMQLQFAGFTCGFTDCANVSFQVEGRRR
jgi:hypothetical protein